MSIHQKMIFRISLFLITVFFTAFDSISQADNFVIIRTIIITGNKVTKEKIIRREFEIAEGDTIAVNDTSAVFRQIQNNLMNMSLFNFADVRSKIDSSNSTNSLHHSTDILVHVTERLYIWPVPYLYLEERNFNEWLEHKDLSRLNWGATVVHENFRGHHEQVSLGFKTGFNDLIVLKYNIPAIDKKQNTGLSFAYSFARVHNVFYDNIENSRKILELNNTFAIRNSMIHASMTRRHGIFQTFRGYIQFNQYNFSDTLFTLNPDFVEPQTARLEFFTISLLYKYDFRDYIHYPLEGFYYDCEIIKQGLGILSDERISIVNFKTSFRKYWKLDERLYFASGITTRLRLDSDRSYYFGRGLGFGNDYVRGYEQYVIDGQNYVLLKSNIKYNFIRPGIITLGFIRTEKFRKIPYRFYINAFADAGYIKDKYTFEQNPLSNTILLGYGIGIDFVTYYDRAYRFEISRNSKNEFSFALQFTAPI